VFSLKTLHVKFRRFLPALLARAACLLAVELAFRHWQWQYDYDGWESPGLMKKMHDAEAQFAREGSMDLVTLSSSVGRALDLTQWQDAAGNSFTAYNFCYAEQRPERQNFLFQNIIYPRYKPGHVIYALSLIDCNSNVRAMDPRKPRTGPFWQYRNIRSMAADSPTEKLLAWLSDYSLLFRARQRFRFSLQTGPIWMIEAEPTIGDGIPLPTIRQQAFGPMPLSWALTPAGQQYNTYRDYWIPDDGEIGEVIKLGKFCREHGVKFTVVEMPSSPYGHSNWGDQENGYWKFTNALNYVASKGIPVHPLARDVSFDNTMFEDQEHLNRWGGQLATNYIYEKVIRQWYPQARPEQLHEATQYELAALQGDEPTTSVTAIAALPATPDAEYAARRQLQVAGDAIVTVAPELRPGSYTLELYAGDGTTTTPELTGAAKMTLMGAGVKLPLRWENTRVGISYTRAEINVTTTGPLQLQIRNSGTQPVILDSSFVRPLFTPPLRNQVTLY